MNPVKTYLDISVDAKVVCAEGVCGRTVCAVLNPVSDQVTHVVVEEDEFPNVSRLVPLDLIRESDPQHIRIDCSKADLARMDVFSEAEFIPYGAFGSPVMLPFTVPVSAGISLEHDNIPAGELAVRRGSRVEARDGYIGNVDEFVVDRDGYRITHLILRKGHLWAPKDVTIPVSQIDRMEDNTVYLKLTRKDVEALPAVRVTRRWS